MKGIFSLYIILMMPVYCKPSIKRSLLDTVYRINILIRSSDGSVSGSLSITAPSVKFPKQLYSGFQGSVFPTAAPALTGNSPTSCTAVPALPAGLAIDTACTISGTAAVGGAGAVYTVTATNSGGSGTASVRLKVMGTAPFRVYGQNGSFSTGTANNCTGGLGTNGANCLNGPRGIAFDSNDNLYLADGSNHRVLFFPFGSTAASGVYGQNDLNSGTANRGGSTNQNTLNTPQGIGFSPSGELYIADTTNNRVVAYAKNDPSTAVRVIGQNGSYVTSGNAAAIDQFSNPGNITFDSLGNYYIAVISHHRVLYYPAGTSAPTKVYGQQSGNFSCGVGNYTSPACTGGATNQNGLSFPISVSIDPASQDVYIMDQLNQRVLGYGNTGTTVPIKLFGQINLNTGAGTACNQSTFNGGPTDGAFDSNGNLFQTDSGGGNRIIVLEPPYTNLPVRVIGQANFTTCTAGSTASGLSNPQWLEFDSFGNLYISDTGNNRVVVY